VCQEENYTLNAIVDLIAPDLPPVPYLLGY